MFYGIDSDFDTTHFHEKSISGGTRIEFKGDKVNFSKELETINEQYFVNFIPLFKRIQILTTTTPLSPSSPPVSAP